MTPPAAPAPESRGFTAAVLVLCGLLLSPVLGYRMGLDQGVFAYIGAELLEGRWPYLATWDHAFPGLMFLQAGEILLLGKSTAMFRAFDLAYQLANVYFIYRIGTRVGGRAGAWLGAAVFALIYQGYGPWNTSQREGFGLLFLLWGFWLYLTAERRRPAVTAAWIGLGVGLAALIKPTLVALAACYAPLLWRPDREKLRTAAVAGAAAAAPVLLTVGLYAALGGLRELYEACIAYQTQVYVHRLRGDGPLLGFWLSKLRRMGVQALGLAILYPPFLLRGAARRERAMLYLGYLGSLFAVFTQGTFAGYHYLPGLGIGAVLVGSAFHQVTAWALRGAEVRLLGRPVALATLAAHAAVLLAIPVYVNPEWVRRVASGHFLEPPVAREFRILDVFDFTEDWELAAYLRAHTRPGDRIQVWGHESLVYYLAERDAASRFQTSNPLVMRAPGREITPMQQRWRREFLADVAAREPPYVVVTRDDAWWWAPGERTSEQLLDDFPEWKRVIEEDYEPAHEIGRFRIHRRRDGPDER